MVAVFERLRAYSHLIVLSHSVFALPFALLMLVVVSRAYPVSAVQVALLVACVVAARAAAMSFNRLVDAQFDAHNVRTQGREIPSGVVSRYEAIALVIVASVIFIAASSMLGWHCGILSIPVLGVLLGYSFVKRYSAICHFVLGVSLALAPGGVWYALTATWSWYPVPLMCAVLLWVAGFDMLYACQDVEFDREHGLFSVPSRFGVARAQVLAALLHGIAVICLIGFGALFELGLFFWCGAALFVLMIASQHVAVMRRGLGCIDRVFFTRNGLASVVLFLFSVLDAALG
jgi:4-hydroxybenzoate polyprenyltransferase